MNLKLPELILLIDEKVRWLVDEGKPQEVDCIVSNEVMIVSNAVERSKAKEWTIGQNDEYKVEILDKKHRAFVLQCRLKGSIDLVSRLSKPDLLKKNLNVSFAGEAKVSRPLASWLTEIAVIDQEFFIQMEFAIRDLFEKKKTRARRGETAYLANGKAAGIEEGTKLGIAQGLPRGIDRDCLSNLVDSWALLQEIGGHKHDAKSLSPAMRLNRLWCWEFRQQLPARLDCFCSMRNADCFQHCSICWSSIPRPRCARHQEHVEWADTD
jgi:hypothetical protein